MINSGSVAHSRSIPSVMRKKDEPCIDSCGLDLALAIERDEGADTGSQVKGLPKPSFSRAGLVFGPEEAIGS